MRRKIRPIGFKRLDEKEAEKAAEKAKRVKKAPKVDENVSNITDNVPAVNENAPAVNENAPAVNENVSAAAPLMVSPAQADLIETIENLADIISSKEFSKYPEKARINFVNTFYNSIALNTELTTKTMLLMR